MGPNVPMHFGYNILFGWKIHTCSEKQYTYSCSTARIWLYFSNKNVQLYISSDNMLVFPLYSLFSLFSLFREWRKQWTRTTEEHTSFWQHMPFFSIIFCSNKCYKTQQQMPTDLATHACPQQPMLGPYRSSNQCLSSSPCFSYMGCLSLYRGARSVLQ